jgi:outer membrane protein TolC
MVTSRSMVAMLIGALGIACAGSGVSASLAVAHAGLERQEALPAESALRPSASPWWSAFGSQTLDSLIAAARRAADAAGAGGRLDAPSVEIGVSAAYVAVLARTLRLTYIENVRLAVRRQSQLMAANPALYGDFGQELKRREAGAEASAKTLEEQREAQFAFLADRCHMPVEALKKAVGEMAAEREIPQFAAPVPSALPAALLANRDDIQLAASLHGIEPLALLEGTVDATDESGGGTREADADLPGYPLYPHAVAQGRAEVAEALRRLQALSDSAAGAHRRVDEAKALFELSKTRMSRGELSEVQMLEDFQGLMLELQKMAATDGDLSIAWVALVASLGSRTPVVLRATPASNAAAFRGLPGLAGVF